MSVLDVRPLRPGELDRLLEIRPAKPLRLHTLRLERQHRGDVVYLVAWDGERAVGHAMVHRPDRALPGWSDECGDRFMCPHVEDLFVDEGHRRRGIASMLLDEAEIVACRWGAERIGLGVGIDNQPARELYAKRGYEDAGLGTFITSGQVLMDDGRRWIWLEIETFLMKPLR